MGEQTILTNHTANLTINGAEYTITSKGEVFGAYGQPIKIRPNADGYASFTAGKKGMRTRVMVHRLVAELFLPNPNNLSDVDHLDSDRMNPSVDNLEWVSHEENIRRAYERGHHEGRAVGENNNRSRLNKDIVNQIRMEYWFYSVTVMEISKKYNIPWTTVDHVVKGETWVHIPMPELTPELEEILQKNPRFNPRPKE